MKRARSLGPTIQSKPDFCPTCDGRRITKRGLRKNCFRRLQIYSRIGGDSADGYGVFKLLQQEDADNETNNFLPSMTLVSPEDQAANQPQVFSRINKPPRRQMLRGCLCAALNPEGPGATRNQEPSTPQERRKILVVEDNAVKQKLSLSLPGKNGSPQAELAVNGAEACNMIHDATYAVILMDLRMPVMGGLEVAIKIREIEQTTGHHTPILAVTAHAAVQDEKRCLEREWTAISPTHSNVHRFREPQRRPDYPGSGHSALCREGSGKELHQDGPTQRNPQAPAMTRGEKHRPSLLSSPSNCSAGAPFLFTYLLCGFVPSSDASPPSTPALAFLSTLPGVCRFLQCLRKEKGS
jgi:CheY-like chemotaxis protein